MKGPYLGGKGKGAYLSTVTRMFLRLVRTDMHQCGQICARGPNIGGTSNTLSPYPGFPACRTSPAEEKKSVLLTLCNSAYEPLHAFPRVGLPQAYRAGVVFRSGPMMAALSGASPPSAPDRAVGTCLGRVKTNKLNL